MKSSLSIEQIISCLQKSNDAISPRGDHDLNPGVLPSTQTQTAAVLIPLIAHDGGVTVLLTRRTDHLDHHPGQISFPGGRIEDHDKSPQDGALRETHEEIGIAREFIQVISELEPYITRTGFHITPVIGVVQPPVTLTLDSFEVAEAFEVPLDFLCNPENHQKTGRIIDGQNRRFYAMDYQGYYIWGATAGMIFSLYEKLRPALTT